MDMDFLPQSAASPALTGGTALQIRIAVCFGFFFL